MIDAGWVCVRELRSLTGAPFFFVGFDPSLCNGLVMKNEDIFGARRSWKRPVLLAWSLKALGNGMKPKEVKRIARRMRHKSVAEIARWARREGAKIAGE